MFSDNRYSSEQSMLRIFVTSEATICALQATIIRRFGVRTVCRVRAYIVTPKISVCEPARRYPWEFLV